MSRLHLVKYTGIIAALGLVIACFIPWVTIRSGQIVVTGIAAEGTSFGKPGYFHLLLVILFLVCTITPRVWAKRLNLLVTALNLAWAVRNFFVIAACYGGECPVKEPGLYLVLITSILMMVSALFPDMKLPANRK